MYMSHAYYLAKLPVLIHANMVFSWVSKAHGLETMDLDLHSCVQYFMFSVRSLMFSKSQTLDSGFGDK